MRIPAALIVDDGSPVNLMVWHQPDFGHKMLVPASLGQGFADVCGAYGVRGKFSVVPMPAGLGRIDRELAGVPARQVAQFVMVVAKRLAPAFDITPEILTHLCAVNLEQGWPRHMWEDVWVSTAKVGELTDYIAQGIEILQNVGLNPNGLTSPWMTGIDNEKVYAAAISNAFWRARRQKFAWYFLHCLGRSEPRWPWVTHQNRAADRVVVTVPANTDDPWWDGQYPRSLRGARAAARRGTDSMLSADGKRGRIRAIVDAQMPVTIVTHWQSLFGNGRMAGLWGFELLCARMQALLGDDIEWMRCSDLARRAVSGPVRGGTARGRSAAA